MKSARTSLPMWLITFVTLIGFTSLWFHYDRSFDVAMYGVIVMALCWTAYFILSSMSVDDQYILLIVLMLFSIGIIMIFRCDKPDGINQIKWLAVGLVAFFVTYMVVLRTKFISGIGYGFFIAAVVISLLTIFIGTSADGTSVKNWIIIGPISIQTTEIVKYLILFILADRYYTPKRYRIFGMHEGVTVSVFLYILLAIMAVQGELGTILVVFTTYIAMMYLFNEERWIIWGTIGLVVLGALALWLLQDVPFIDGVWDKLAGRFEVWDKLWELDHTTVNGVGEMRQSMYAIGSGGFFGAGVGHGSPDIISGIGAEKSDYIFASISEEMGIMIGVAIILMFFLLMYRGLRLSLNIKHKFYRTIGAGICLMFGFQTFIIIGGVTNLIPLTGITLPFVSSGGSSLVVGFLALGFLEGAANKTDDTLKAMVKKSGGIKGADYMGDERYSHSVLRKGDELSAEYTVDGNLQEDLSASNEKTIWEEQDLSYQEDYERQRTAGTVFFSAGDLNAFSHTPVESNPVTSTEAEIKYSDEIVLKKPTDKPAEHDGNFFSGGGDL